MALIPQMQVATATQSLSIEFGAKRSECRSVARTHGLRIKVPLLAGPTLTPLLAGCTVSRAGEFLLGTCGENMAGVVSVEVSGSLENPTFQLYRALLEHLDGRQIHRVWNYVPHINSRSGVLENYRSFNIGRHRAFEERFGTSCTSHMSPASAIGTDDDQLAIAFIAGAPGMQHVENPEQTPAFRYPIEHGPKSPSFSRGSHGIIDGSPCAFLSGTSSIKGHRSIDGNTLGEQFDTTIDNVRIVLAQMGYADALEGSAALDRQFSIYLRHADDLGAVRERFRQIVGEAGIAATRFLQADICRKELLLEIEGTFRRI